MDDPYQPPAAESTASEKPTEEKPPAIAHIACGWPLLLLFIGGAIGGGLGGAAYGINMNIYKSEMPVAAKVVLNILTGLAAGGLWFAIAVAISGGLR